MGRHHWFQSFQKELQHRHFIDRTDATLCHGKNFCRSFALSRLRKSGEQAKTFHLEGSEQVQLVFHKFKQVSALHAFPTCCRTVLTWRSTSARCACCSTSSTGKTPKRDCKFHRLLNLNPDLIHTSKLQERTDKFWTKQGSFLPGTT